MLAKRANVIVGQGIALIYVAAHLAHKAFFALGFGPGLYVVLVVGVGHRFLIGNNTCFTYRANKHTVGVKVKILLYLQGHKGVYVAGQEYKTVIAAQRLAIGKLIGGSAACKAKPFKHSKGCLGCKAVDVHFA